MNIYLEVGEKRVIACSIDWPGWSRGGRDEATAKQMLLDYAPRYAAVLKGTRLGFHPPKTADEFKVVARVKGNATTDYGVPDKPIDSDDEPLEGDDLRTLHKLLTAYWDAFDAVVHSAKGHKLRKGPRGGGRDLDDIVRHVEESSQGYLSRLAWKLPKDVDTEFVRQATLDAIDASAKGQLPKTGPRGGVIWTARRFVRRLGWHILDHAWEIQDRLV